MIELCAITLFPMLWMLSTSFKIPTEVFTKDIRIPPKAPTLANFPDAFRFVPVAHWFWNSSFIATVTTAGKLLISIPAAFAFARLKFRGGNVCFALVLGTMIVAAGPAIAVVTILSFLSSWNQYTWPLLVIEEINSKTLEVGMQVFASNSESAQLLGPMMAAAVLATVPPLLIHAIAQKQIIPTFMTSGMNG